MHCVSRVNLSILLCFALIVLFSCGKDSPTKPKPPQPPPQPPVQPVPTRITITPSKHTLNAVGQTVRLTALVQDQNNNTLTGAVVTWSSGNPAVATVNNQGLVTAVMNGTAMITARSGTASTSITVTVMQTAGTITIEPMTATLMALGETVQLAATVLDQNSQPVADAVVTWSSSDETVATVNAEGLMTGVGNGTATITVRSGSAFVEIEITVRSSDRDVLVALFNKTDGPNWAISTNWLSDAPLGSWYGVTVDDDGRVTELNLRDNNLHGMIPAEISNLEELMSLQINHNRLTGEVPSELGFLTKLERLTLSSNLLTGEIPAELGNLARLKELNLSFNRLSGPVPRELSQLTILEMLSLSVNDLAGPIPSELGQLNQLVSLRIDQNELTGAIPTNLSRLTSLKSLILSQNRLSGEIPPQLSAPANLEDLVLSHNRLTGNLPPELSRLAYLKQLRLADNLLTGGVPPEYGRLANLTHLQLYGNSELTGSLPQELTVLSLEELLLEGTKLCAPMDSGFQLWLEGIPIKSVTYCSGLERIALEVLHFATDGPDWTVSTNWLSGSPLGNWYGITTGTDGLVTGINLENNGLSGSLPSEIAILASLKNLNLKNNQYLSGPLPREIISLSLEELSLEGTQLCVPPDDEFKTWLSAIPVRTATPCSQPSLETLDALFALFNRTNGSEWTDRSNWNSDAPIEEWYGVTTNGQGHVTELNLSNNNLRGILPPELARLTDLVRIDFSNNEGLTGPLPQTFSQLLSLEELSLDGTQICMPPDVVLQEWLIGLTLSSIIEDCTDTRPEWYILAALYNSTDGANWTNNENWLSDSPLDEWYGVTTNAVGRVSGLEIAGNGLSGPIPSEIGKLTNLGSLHLSGNDLSGPIPPELGQLTNLERLHLNGNDLSGPIPQELGQLTDLIQLILIGNRLSGPIPPELGQLTELTNLNLSYNDLSGAIPPALGQLTELNYLELANTGLSGAIPPEIGQLTDLSYCVLSANHLSGTIPPELGQLTNLERLHLNGNGLSGPIPPELGQLTELTNLNLSYNDLSGAIPPALGQLTELNYLELANTGLSGAIPPEIGQLTDLSSCVLSANHLSGTIPPELGQLTNLEWLHLNGNGLSGSIPPELGQMSNLNSLNLSDNTLTGSLPLELGQMSQLRTLDLSSNAGLSGMLPQSITALSLDELQLGGTSICVPGTPSFRFWLQNIQSSSVASCIQSSGSVAYVTQATQSISHPVPLVAGEDALLRVFVKTDLGEHVSLPPVTAAFYQNGQEIHNVEIPRHDTNVPSEVDEGILSQSANAEVPGSVVMPGLEMVVNINPEGNSGTVPGFSERIPPEGRMLLDVRSLPVFNLTLVPFLWMESPQVSVLTDTEGLTAEDELFWQTRNLLPIADFDVKVREPVWTSTDPVVYNSRAMLQETLAVRVMDGSGGHYMGILRAGGGRAELPGTSSVSVLDAETIAHELGHNLNLYHSPCGGAGGPDPNYPYGDGTTGSWGYDIRNGMLVAPETADLMSYCHPQWISEYGFTRAFNYLHSETQRFAASIIRQEETSLLIWGGVNENGDLVLEPSFVVNAAPSFPRIQGSYRLTGESADGGTLFELDFGMVELGDGDGGAFAFVIPVQTDWQYRLTRISFSGPEGIVTLDRESNRTAAILMDRSTGRIRGLLRNWLDPSGILPGVRRTLPEPGLEITVSTGIPDSESW